MAISNIQRFETFKKLGIGSELQRVALDPKHPHRLASEAEILALMPELKPPG